MNGLNVTNIRLEKPAVISGNIAGDSDREAYFLLKKEGMLWTLLVKIRDGQYFKVEDVPVAAKEIDGFPNKTLQWLYNNRDIVLDKKDKRNALIERLGGVSIFDKIEIEINKEFIPSEDSSSSHFIEGKVLTSKGKYFFDLICSKHENWTLFIRDENSTDNIRYNNFPVFKEQDYNNRKIIQWIGDYSKTIISFLKYQKGIK